MVDVIVLDKKTARLKRAVLASAKVMASELGCEKKHVEIFLVGSNAMDKNVLAFPADAAFPRPDLKEQALGEIYLNPQYITEHGEDLMHMLAHGLLHLLGYDHMKERDRIEMEKKEAELLKLLK